FFGITQVIQSNAYAAYLALGRPDIPARVTAVHVIVLLASLVTLTAMKGVIGAAIAYLVTAAVMVPITFAFLFPRLGLKVRAFLAVTWRPLIAAAVMYFTVRGFIDFESAVDTSGAVRAAYLIGAVALGMSVYLATLALLWLLSGKPASAEVAA